MPRVVLLGFLAASLLAACCIADRKEKDKEDKKKSGSDVGVVREHLKREDLTQEQYDALWATTIQETVLKLAKERKARMLREERGLSGEGVNANDELQDGGKDPQAKEPQKTVVDKAPEEPVEAAAPETTLEQQNSAVTEGQAAEVQAPEEAAGKAPEEVAADAEAGAAQAEATGAADAEAEASRRQAAMVKIMSEEKAKVKALQVDTDDARAKETKSDDGANAEALLEGDTNVAAAQKTEDGAKANTPAWKAARKEAAGAATKAFVEGVEDLPTSFLKIGPTEECQQLVFSSDIEGNLDHWHKLLQYSGAFEPAADGTLVHLKGTDEKYNLKETYNLKEGFCFVYGGDNLDCAGNSGPNFNPFEITRNMVELSEKNAARFVIILGNRDLNKLRLKTELYESAKPEDFPYYWHAANSGSTEKTVQQAPETRPSWTKEDSLGSRLEKILDKSMGAKIDGLREALVARGVIKTENKALANDQTAKYIVQLLSSSGNANWWTRYLKRGVLLAAAKIENAYALFSHTGLHPLMFNALGSEEQPKLWPFTHGSLMVPTSAGLGSYLPQGTNTSKDPLPFDLTTEGRVKLSRDQYQYSRQRLATDPPVPKHDTIKEWVQDYAAWKTKDFEYWSAREANVGTAANRPGLQLIDAGLGNLGGLFRGAGFTIGGPCTAWEYGIQPGSLYDSPTYEEGMTPDVFGKLLQTKWKIKYTYNGHFTEPGNALPLQFSMGGVIVHNHDLTKTENMLDRASFSILQNTVNGGYQSSQHWWNHLGKVSKNWNPLGKVSKNLNKFVAKVQPQATHNTLAGAKGRNVVGQMIAKGGQMIAKGQSVVGQRSAKVQPQATHTLAVGQMFAKGQSLVGQTFQVKDNMLLLDKCKSPKQMKNGFTLHPWRPVITPGFQQGSDKWAAFVQDQTPDHIVIKLVQKKGFVWGNTAEYCFLAPGTKLEQFSLKV